MKVKKLSKKYLYLTKTLCQKFQEKISTLNFGPKFQTISAHMSLFGQTCESKVFFSESALKNIFFFRKIRCDHWRWPWKGKFSCGHGFKRLPHLLWLILHFADFFKALHLCVSMDEIFDRKLLSLIDYYIQELFKQPDEDTGLTNIFNL